MYEPPHFRIEDREAAFAVIRRHPLGILISGGACGLIANPVPFTLAKSGEGEDVLRAHLARPNGQWKALAEAPEALVVFQGVEHYVTPSWYETKRETGKVVPTWNYVHVQVKGRATIHEDPAFLADQIAALTDQHEGVRAEPWAVADAPDAFIQAQMRGIVGIEIAIETLTAKFKLSQNRNAADRAGVSAGLESEKDASGPEMAGLIAEMFGKPVP